jgi:hypothetical protein
VLQILIDHASLPAAIVWPTRVAVVAAPLLVAGGFFGVAHAASLRILLYAGAATVIVTTLIVDTGLMRAP